MALSFKLHSSIYSLDDGLRTQGNSVCASWSHYLEDPRTSARSFRKKFPCVNTEANNYRQSVERFIDTYEDDRIKFHKVMINRMLLEGCYL